MSLVKEVSDHIMALNQQSNFEVKQVRFTSNAWERFSRELLEMTGVSLRTPTSIKGAIAYVDDEDSYTRDKTITYVIHEKVYVS